MTTANITEQFTEIRSTILSWLSDLLPVDVVELEQGTPRPRPPFVGFKILTVMEPIGVYDETGFKGDNFTVTGHRHIMISLEAVEETRDFRDKPRATDLLAEIQFDLDNPLANMEFNAVGLSVIDKGSVIDVTKILENDFEPRAVLDVRFGIAIQKILPVTSIGSVEVEGELDSDFDGIPDHTVNITANEP